MIKSLNLKSTTIHSQKVFAILDLLVATKSDQLQSFDRKWKKPNELLKSQDWVRHRFRPKFHVSKTTPIQVKFRRFTTWLAEQKLTTKSTYVDILGFDGGYEDDVDIDVVSNEEKTEKLSCDLNDSKSRNESLEEKTEDKPEVYRSQSPKSSTHDTPTAVRNDDIEIKPSQSHLTSLNPYFPLTPKDSSPESLRSRPSVPQSSLFPKPSSPVTASPVVPVHAPGISPGLEQLAQLAQSAHLARAAIASANLNPAGQFNPFFNPFLPRISPVINPLLNLYGLNPVTAHSPVNPSLAESTSLYLRSREAIATQLAQNCASQFDKKL